MERTGQVVPAGDTWDFQFKVFDICNKGVVVYTSKVRTLNF